MLACAPRSDANARAGNSPTAVQGERSLGQGKPGESTNKRSHGQHQSTPHARLRKFGQQDQVFETAL